LEVVVEWQAMPRQGKYSPRLDIAIGPFATGDLVYVNEFDDLMRRHRGFMEALYERSHSNFRDFGEMDRPLDFEQLLYQNRNARCFMAVEIENKVSRKHLMGGAINAASLGRVGVAVGWTEDKVRAFVKLRAYLLYLSGVGKNTFNPFNLLVLSKDQFDDVVGRFERL